MIGQPAYLALRTSVRSAGALLFAIVVGCGGDDESEPAAVPVDRHDAGHDDASMPKPEPDAGGINVIRDQDDKVLCAFEEAGQFSVVLEAAGSEPTLAADARGFAMVYGGAPGKLYIRAIPALDGEPEPPVQIASAQDAVASPLLSLSGDRFLLSFRNALDDRLFARPLEAGASARLVTDRVAVDDAGGVLSALLGLEDGFVLAWVDRDDGLHLERLSADGSVAEAEVHGDIMQSPRDVHLGLFEGGRILVSWLTTNGDDEGVVMGQLFEPELVPAADAVMLSSSPVSGARFDMAVHRGSAGVIYPAVEGGVRETIKFRRVEPDGSVTGPLLNIVDAPRRTRDGAIAAFGQGYVVSHRQLTSRGEPEEQIQVAFVNQFGAIVHRGNLGTTSVEGGRTAVAATESGQVLAVWNAIEPDGRVTSHGFRLDCPGALVLCGGELH